MTIYAAVQSTYTSIELAVFKGEELLELAIIGKHQASKMLIPVFGELLTKNNLSLKNLSFMVVNRGPAPFTTLRTVIATANALGWGSHIPLLGISGIDALVAEYQSEQKVTVALLNAFNEDVYFGWDVGGVMEVGCLPHAVLIENVAREFVHKNILFVGNAAQTYEAKLREVFGDWAFFSAEQPQTASIEQIARMGYAAWHKNEGMAEQIVPLYLKKPTLFQRA